MSSKYIEIKEARGHNLKNVSVKIPKDKLIVVTGKSGSGKSTLIMDTLFKYAKKNYLDALSSKEFAGVDNIDCDVSYIKNIQPPVAISQRKNIMSNPRSTIGTMTNIDGYLKLLFSSLGKPVCPICLKETDQELYCEDCGCFGESLTPQDFSPTSKEGMCLRCNGVGRIVKFTEDKVIPDKTITLNVIWDTAKKNTFNAPGTRQIFNKFLEHFGYTGEERYLDLPDDFKEKVLYGSEEKFEIQLKKVKNYNNFVGILTYLDNQYKKTTSAERRKDLEYYLDNTECPECKGGKLKQTSLHVKVAGEAFSSIQSKTFRELLQYLNKLRTIEYVEKAIQGVISELQFRVENICSMSIDYLQLNRQVSTLSGGELQKLLISQHVSSDLTGVMYLLDEPTVGLHDRDADKVIGMLKKLRDIGNTVIVIEHDEKVIWSADYVIEIGPGAGIYGGEVIAEGTPQELLENKNSLMSHWFKSRKRIRMSAAKKQDLIELKDMNYHNLKDLKINFPNNQLTCITGVSGCGKSSLVNNLYDVIRHDIVNHVQSSEYSTIPLSSKYENIIYIDQNPIRGSSRSNIMTYIGFFDQIRNMYAKLAKESGNDFSKSDFSINVPGGRCECCNGQGVVEIDMYFMKNEYMTCKECNGKRFKNEILDVKYKGLNISEIFELSVEKALDVFADAKMDITNTALKMLSDFGLNYLKLGQTTDSLSGGEAQRIHLISELINAKNVKALFIFDEPSIGLHVSDIEYLIRLFDKLIMEGKSILVIEHNMDIIYNSDYIIDLGPEAGDGGGNLIFEGAIDEFLKTDKGYTVKFLKEHIDAHYKRL